jgi:hypothetical protein
MAPCTAHLLMIPTTFWARPGRRTVGLVRRVPLVGDQVISLIEQFIGMKESESGLKK